MKKIISTILIVILIAVQLVPILNVSAEETLVITTYGENEDGINPNLVTNTANLIVSDVINDDVLSAYKIIDVFYNKETNEMTYDFTTNFRNFLDQNEDYGETFTIERYFELTGDNPDGSASTSVITTSTLNVLVSKYVTYIRNNNIKSTVDLLTTETNAMAEVEVGAYLVLPKVRNKDNLTNELFSASIITMYGVLVANVVPSIDLNGNWKQENCVIYAKAINQGFINPLFFNFDMDELFSGNLNDLDITPYNDISSYFGTEHLLYVTGEVYSMPTNTLNKIYNMEIELPSGLSYDSENVYTEINGNEGIGTVIKKFDNNILVDENNIQIGTIYFQQQKIIINVDVDLITGQNIFFNLFVNVSLNENAIVGNLGNSIISTLVITDDPYIENSTINFNNTNTIYTYGLELTSLSTDDSTLLKGAKYEIYSKYTDSVLSNKIGEFTVGDDGKAIFAGVPSGTIYLKQVKAPTGYQLIKEPIAVEIATEDATAGTQDGYYQVITYNDAKWYLPSTGGIGTILYTVIGLLVIGISTYAIVYYRKKKFN